MKILGIDPSLRCTGMAVINVNPGRMELVWSDCLQFVTAVNLPEEWIAGQVFLKISPWLDADFIGIEMPIGARSYAILFRQALMVGGLLALIPEEMRAKVVRVSPTQTKAAVGASFPGWKAKGSKGGKELVIQAVGKLVGTDWFPENRFQREAICDAIAVAKAAQLLS